MRIWIAGVLGVLLVGGVGLAQELLPVGDEFVVNSDTANYQLRPAVAADAEGRFVVVWHDYDYWGGTRTSFPQARRFDANGAPLGCQFRVGTHAMYYRSRARVAADALGNFLVVWDVGQAQLYDASGTPVGGEFEVNPSGLANDPAVAAGPEGSFVVVFDDTAGIQGQRFDAAGTPVGGQFQVNTYTTGGQGAPSVAVEAKNGDIVVVWESDGSYGTDTDPFSVQGQRFDAMGTPVGGQFQVNTYTTDGQGLPSVAVDANSNFVVVWESGGSSGTDTDYGSIQGQRFDANGAPVGGQFQVNTETYRYQWRPAVATDAEGNFLVVWKGYWDIEAQFHDASGARVGGEFRVGRLDVFDRFNVFGPGVAADPGGRFVVVWQGTGAYPAYYDVHGKRYATTAIFADGFESGDASEWSSSRCGGESGGCWGDLLVTNQITKSILRYDRDTGAFIDAFVPTGSGGLNAPYDLVLGPDNELYVTSSSTDSILRYDGQTGVFIDVFVPTASGGLNLPSGLTFGPDGNLYVSSVNNGLVKRYDGLTGGFIDTFVPCCAGGASIPSGLLFGPDGNLLLASFGNDQVLRYDGQTGAFIDAFVPATSGGLDGPNFMTFGPDASLYVTSQNTNSVLRYDGQTGAFIDAFVPTGGGGLGLPGGLVFGPDGDLYVSGWNPPQVLLYDGQSGLFVDTFVAPGSGGLNSPHALVFQLAP